MARHNIVFGQDQAVQQGRNYNAPQFGQSQGGPAQGTQWSSGFDQQGGDQLEAMYARPAATGQDTGRMTMRDALNAITATLGLIVVVGFVIAVTPMLLGVVAGEAGQQLGLLIAGAATLIGLIGGLVLALVNIFKKQPSAVLVLAYAGFEGLLLGGISGTMENIYPGIALQAVLGTLAVAGTVLVLFRMGILRTSPALNKIFMVAMIAYLIFGVVNIGYLLISGTSLREGVVGLIIGGLAVVMASYCLVMDFEDVQRAASAGAPRNYAWRCAFGLAATMVWLYIEILRILAILRGN
ncbi:Bax inhibitor-1/YccA family protein [Brachybacterium sp. FME24]|uniref:Bax inhibitor-1/YccA family protein n=1 Tax=Brachybacterium sp. FME24 TaxID=2742605 RepID=UPI0018671918|nr:Bax inhibitor-1/YccA family protein [Brachybacterium sp. FME24]